MKAIIALLSSLLLVSVPQRGSVTTLPPSQPLTWPPTSTAR